MGKDGAHAGFLALPLANLQRVPAGASDTAACLLQAQKIMMGGAGSGAPGLACYCKRTLLIIGGTEHKIQIAG